MELYDFLSFSQTLEAVQGHLFDCGVIVLFFGCASEELGERL